MIGAFLLFCTYFVSFTDKAGSNAPALGERAFEQRFKWDIPIDSLDFAVSPVYLDSLRAMGAKVLHTSRWFNGATVQFDKRDRERIENCSFVSSVELTRDSIALVADITTKSNAMNDSAEYPESDPQQGVFNLKKLHDAGFQGQGILLAVIDCGFQNCDKLACYEPRTHFKGQYDFTDEPYDIYDDATGFHGEMCLSTIAAQTDNYHGAATAADYCLMRTEEVDAESPKELDNMVAALELADSLGVNIATISLGYIHFNSPAFDIPYGKMDGKSSRASIACTIAARKGMLVCLAAGNEGKNPGHFIGWPTDADSIISVGAVSEDREIAPFSSYGPTPDGRIKPEVCAVGWKCRLIDPADGQVISRNGTSFACPLLAGMAACLWSALPNENAMQIRERIIRSADRFSLPDDRYGYGIPDAWAAYMGTTTGVASAQINAQGTARVVYTGHGNLFIEKEGVRYSLSGIRLDDGE